MDQNPQFMCLEKVKSAKMYSISIKTIQLSGKNHLVSLSLYDVLEDHIVLSEDIVPEVLYQISPDDDNYECRQCCSKPSFHFEVECPLLEKCSVCLNLFETDHLKSNCTTFDLCWNCGEVHNWRRCPKPLVNAKQNKFKETGLDFEINNQRKTFVHRGDKVSQCSRDLDVLKSLLAILK